MAPPTLRRARVRVPCSTSNLGAGFDAIGLAFDRHISAQYSPGAGTMTVERTGTCEGLTDQKDALLRAFIYRLSESRVFPAGKIRVNSEIPLSRGLGSSAAAVVAGLALADAAVGLRTPDRAKLLGATIEIEGHPDNAAPSLYGGLVAVARGADGEPRAFSLQLAPEIGWSFAAPNVEVPTPLARRALPAEVPHALAARAVGRMAALVRGLANADADLLRIGFDDELHVPHRLPLIPNARKAIDAALSAGAWAVTISGSGSGLIAVGPLSTTTGVAMAMSDAFGQTDPGFAFAAQPETSGIVVEADI